MIDVQITGRHFDLDDDIVGYTQRKLGGLDRFLPRRWRNGLSGTVVLEYDESHTQDSQNICDVKIQVKGENLQAREATLNMYAAIDICEHKLKSQILSLKSKHDPARNRGRRLVSKMLGRTIPQNPDQTPEDAAGDSA